MSEPLSGAAASAAAGAAAGVAGWKMIGGLAGMGAIGAGLAAVVVMALTKPKSEQEWRIALICTVVGSVCGGAALVKYLNIEHWAQSEIGMIAMLGLAFACGLPAWGIVRWIFNYIDKRRDHDIAEVVKEARGIL